MNYLDKKILDIEINALAIRKTAFFLTYDENDGFFDHIVLPTPPQSRAEGISTVGTTNEIFPGDRIKNLGLGRAKRPRPFYRPSPDESTELPLN